MDDLGRTEMNEMMHNLNHQEHMAQAIALAARSPRLPFAAVIIDG